MQILAQRLKELRRKKQITQRELASYLHLSANIVCEWEKGRCSPNIDTLKKLSDFFECTVDYLIGNTDDFGNVTELLKLYTELPPYMQEVVFAELKGIHQNLSLSKTEESP